MPFGFLLLDFLGTPAFTANQLTQTVVTVVQPDQYLPLGDLYWKIILGIIFVLIAAWVILGGLQKIVKVTAKLVPLMVMVYFSMGVFILFDNSSLVLPALNAIFTEAFNFNTALLEDFGASFYWEFAGRFFLTKVEWEMPQCTMDSQKQKNPFTKGLSPR